MGYCKFEGTFFPIFKPGELDWPNPIRAILYILGLGWLFLGVAVVSDVFMNGIEKITSAKKRVKNKDTGNMVTVYVWNATVANLTLMALGSSAPEILLSLIEITSDEFFLGPLGAGTIVGSAAFNLLIISAVCVAAIPDGEVRYIKEVHVYMITSSCSVFAYIWLFIMVMVISPDVCELWEAVVTLMFCPILVVAAYLADRGYFKKKGEEEEDQEEKSMTISDDASPEELAQIEADIRQEHGQSLTDEQVVKIMKAQYFQKHSRAWYRHQAMSATLHGQHHVDKEHCRQSEFIIQSVLGTSDEVADEKAAKQVKFGWASDTYSFLESVGEARLFILRAGPNHCRCSVRYTTQEGTAKAGTDYDAVDAVMIFEKGECMKEVCVNIKDDASWESDEQFTVLLLDAKTDDGSSCSATVSPSRSVTTIAIVDDDAPGDIRFEKEEVEIGEECKDQTVDVTVSRFNGATGKIACQYYTDAMKATEGADFEGTKGVVEFENGQKKAIIPVIVKGRTRVSSATFNLVLKEPTANTKFDPKTDGGEEQCICHITVTHRDKADMFQKMLERVHSANAMAGHKNWGQQFHDALFQIGDDDEEDEEPEGDEPPEPKPPPSKIDIFMHIIGVPWKLLFAFVPPVDYCGGWACFFSALVFIGAVTWWVSDMANLVGCCLGLLPEENAITFVALGTSLPDTFASQTAAQMDPHADASIGNVTGSNSVNVFLGIGISWALAAFYWETHDPTEEYILRFLKLDADVQKNVMKRLAPGDKAAFITPAGTIWFNLMVFSINAFFALQHLYARRRKWGGELGGPKKGFFGQYFSAGFLAFQWFIYVAASSIFMRASGTAQTYEDIAG